MEPTNRPDATGELWRTPFAQVTLELVARRFTGSLVVRAAHDGGDLAGDTTLSFNQGRLAQMRMSQPIETLGDVLLAQGVITRAQCDASLRRLARREGLQGELLVADGACAPEQVRVALMEQLRRKFVRLFALADGRFALFHGKDLLSGFGGERTAIDLAPTFWVGVRTHHEHPAIASVMSTLQGQPLSIGAQAPVDFFSAHRELNVLLVELSRGTRLDVLLAHHPASIVRPLLFMLSVAGMIAPTKALDDRRSMAPTRSIVPLAPRTTLSGAFLSVNAGGAGVSVMPTPRTSIPPARSSQLPPLPVTSPVPPPLRTSMAEIAAVRPSDPTARVQTPVSTPLAPSAVTAAARARYLAMEDKTALELLGVTRDASTAQVAARLFATAQAWQPAAAPNDETREIYEKVNVLLREAEQLLSDPLLREGYLRDLDAGKGSLRMRRTMAQRQEHLTRAEAALKQRNFVEAERAARALLAADANDTDATIALVSAVIELRPQGPFDEVRKLVSKAVEREPENDRVVVLAARLLRAIGDERRAIIQFAKAYKLNPKNIDAGRELRLMVLRSREARAVSPVEPETLAAIKRMMKL